jgi:aldose sugar dehydrogenase
LKELGGKVLRVTRDGAAAPGNATPAGGDPRIYAFGFRNPQGITFHPTTGQPFISEHGPGHDDEVTPLAPGVNGGWDPLCLNGVNYCGYTSNQTDGSPTPMTDLKKFPNARGRSGPTTAARKAWPTATFLRGAQWKAWDGALAVAFLAGTRVEILRLDANAAVTGTTSILGNEGVRIRAVVQGRTGRCI